MGRHRTVFTYDDYKLLPEDGCRWEVLDGDLVRQPAPRPFHQIVVMNLAGLLRAFALGHGLGHVLTAPLDVVLSRENVVQPDIIFIGREQMDVITEENISGAPALVVEVLSPATSTRDREVKRKIYERFGVREYWMVDPHARTVAILALAEEGYVSRGVFAPGQHFSSPLLPGLTVRVADLFHDPFSYR